MLSTANLMDHDWRDIENTVWVQDVSRRPSPLPYEPKLDDFPSILEGVLRAVNVQPALASLVSTGVRRPYVYLRPSVWLIWFIQAPQHPTQ